MSYIVQTEVYEGPFDLLLNLILKRDVDLYEINLTEIVDSFLDEIKRMDSYNLEISTEFLLIASTLIELKCRRLLPNEKEIDLDEELGLWEERDLLLSRLLEAKTFKDVSLTFKELFDSSCLSVPRTLGFEENYQNITPDPLRGMTVNKLRNAFVRITSAKPIEEVNLAHVAEIKWTVAETAENLIEFLRGKGVMKFSEIVESNMPKLKKIINFLALLELFKMGVVNLSQNSCFADLEVELTNDDLSSLQEFDMYHG